MKFVVTSAFRNSNQQQVNRWLAQCSALRKELREHYYCGFRVVAVEGDSTNDTATQLIGQARALDGPALFPQTPTIDLQLVTCNVGGKHYGSVEDPERMRQLSKVGNAMLDAVRESDDVVVYVESDLIWDAATVRRLIDRVVRPDTVPVERWGAERLYADVWAPVVMAGESHYDSYCFRSLDDSRCFHPFPHTQPTEMSSVGSCLVMRASAARDQRCRMQTGALVEWCLRAREAGYRIAVDPSCVIQHPA